MMVRLATVDADEVVVLAARPALLTFSRCQGDRRQAPVKVRLPGGS